MRRQGFRLSQGGLIDRQCRIGFRFNGRRYEGFAGDTLASALLANGVRVIGRSFKYHRPRGVLGAGAEEPSALVAVGRDPLLDTNSRATQVLLTEGLEASSIHCWPTLRFDAGVVADVAHRLIPAGFYYKTFLRPGWAWFETAIRRSAGLGAAPRGADPDRYERVFATCDLLIVGAGPAGLAAARTASRCGARVILADEQPVMGGSLLWTGESIDGLSGPEWTQARLNELRNEAQVTLLPHTAITGFYDHQFLTGLQTMSAGKGAPRQRLWQIRAKRVVLATGSIERPLVFPGNDRPGIMLASAVRQYRNRYGVLAGDSVVVFSNNDSAYWAALELKESGAQVALVDVRSAPPAAVVTSLRKNNIDLYAGYGICRTFGRSGLSGVQVLPLSGSGVKRHLRCTILAMSGGWSPTVHLFSQSGGKLRYDEQACAFVPVDSSNHVRSVGAANGSFALDACLLEGVSAASEAVRSLGFEPGVLDAWASSGECSSPPQPIWRMPDSLAGAARQWIDFQSDVTVADVALAARENFVSVEHLKRYTTLGMATDQGKTSNVNGLAILAQETGKDISAVGTTTFRPHYTPVTFGAIAGRAIGAFYAPRRRLPTHEQQLELAAYMDEYGSWQRPAFYPRPGESEAATLAREVEAVRSGVGIVDYSPLGKVEVFGADAATFLNRMAVTNVATLKPGRARYNFFLNENGVIIDDGVISCLSRDRWLVGTTSGGAYRMSQWLEQWHQTEWPDLRVYISNVTSAWGVIMMSGPSSRELLRRMVDDVDLSAEGFPHMALRVGTIRGVVARIHRVSFTGEISYEVAVPRAYAAGLWDLARRLGADLAVTPFGIESLNVMRLEKGFLHVGSDTDGNTIPQDVGYGGIVVRKPDDFLGRRSLLRPSMKSDDRLQLVGLQSADPAAVLEAGAQLLAEGTRSLPARTQGHVTSSCWSPTLVRPLALGLLQGGRARLGERLSVYSRGSWSKATVTLPAAYDPQGNRLNE